MGTTTTPAKRRKRYDRVVKLIWAEARRRGIDEDLLREMVMDETKGETSSTREMRAREKRALLQRIRGGQPHAASERQIWAIENIYLLRLGWSFDTFGSWLRGDQNPVHDRKRADWIIDNWPTRDELAQKHIKIAAFDAERIIEGLKGAWRSILGIVDVEAEHARLLAIWRLYKADPGAIQNHFHEMKNRPANTP